jgi:hypothetical protein
MISFTYIIPPQVEVISGNEVDTEPYCNVKSIPEESVNQTLLLNSTPFSLNDEWEVIWDYHWAEYDINKFGYNDSDGYHFTTSQLDDAVIVLERRMLIPIRNYTQLTTSAVFEGVSGDASVYFEVFVDQVGSLSEADIAQDGTTTVTLTAPLEAAKSESASLLSSVTFRLQIALSYDSHVILRGIAINAKFTGTMSRVQFDIKSTENVSLYEHPYMKYTDYAPKLVLVQNNATYPIEAHLPCRANDEIYLSPGMYEGYVYWDLLDHEIPLPANSSLWVSDVGFNVTEDIALEVDVGLFAKRIEFDVYPAVFLRSFSIYFPEYSQFYGESITIVGSTAYPQIPNYLYIPGVVDTLSIRVTTWSSVRPRLGWSETERFQIEEDITYNMSNNSRNLLIRITLPYLSIGEGIFGLGSFFILSLVVLLVAGFVVSMRRSLRDYIPRNRLSDSRILPLVMLSVSVFLPWSMQIAQSSNPGFDAVSWISWFPMPLMIQWSNNTGLELLLSSSDWQLATFYSTIFLFIPLFYGYLSLASQEEERFNRFFALALLLPYLGVLSAFNLSVITISTLSIGPIVALAALPVWLLRLVLRRLKITT